MSHQAEKTCIRCGLTKSLTEFHKNSREKDGRHYYCALCKSVIAKSSYKKNPEIAKERSANRFKEKREEILNKNKEWAKNNAQKVKDHRRSNYLLNKEKYLKMMKEYYKNNKHKMIFKSDWKKKNKERANIITHNYRARKKNCGVLSKGITEKLILLQKGKCACCGMSLGDDFHVDHIFPLFLGGKNIDSNIQLLRKTCNLSKGHKDPVEYMQSIGKLL